MRTTSPVQLDQPETTTYIKVHIPSQGQIMQRIEARVAISVSDLKKNPSAVFDHSGGDAVAVLNHNRVMGYMVPAAVYEAMVELIDEADLVRIAKDRAGEPSYPVALDGL